MFEHTCVYLSVCQTSAWHPQSEKTQDLEIAIFVF